MLREGELSDQTIGEAILGFSRSPYSVRGSFTVTNVSKLGYQMWLFCSVEHPLEQLQLWVTKVKLPHDVPHKIVDQIGGVGFLRFAWSKGRHIKDILRYLMASVHTLLQAAIPDVRLVMGRFWVHVACFS